MAKTILIVEDEPDIVKLIEYNLHQAGFKTMWTKAVRVNSEEQD